MKKKQKKHASILWQRLLAVEQPFDGCLPGIQLYQQQAWHNLPATPRSDHIVSASQSLVTSNQNPLHMSALRICSGGRAGEKGSKMTDHPKKNGVNMKKDVISRWQGVLTKYPCRTQHQRKAKTFRNVVVAAASIHVLQDLYRMCSNWLKSWF